MARTNRDAKDARRQTARARAMRVRDALRPREGQIARGMRDARWSTTVARSGERGVGARATVCGRTRARIGGARGGG